MKREKRDLQLLVYLLKIMFCLTTVNMFQCSNSGSSVDVVRDLLEWKSGRGQKS